MKPKAEWAIDSEAISKIQLVGKKYLDKTTLAGKTRFSDHCFGFQSRRFSQLNQTERSIDNRPLVEF